MDKNVKSFSINEKIVVGIALLIGFIILAAGGSYVIEPGHRGVKITLGKVEPGFLPEGMGFKMPFASTVVSVSTRQKADPLTAECYSSDLQQISAELKVLYRIPEQSVVRIYTEYSGDAFESLVAPRVQEAIKEITALLSAEGIVKQREEVKTKALASARIKVGNLLVLEDLVIQNIHLSKELEVAIEQKMVQEQEAAKAKFIQQKAEIEASTAIIKAKGEAEAIKVRGQAMRENPSLVHLQIVEKWDGKAPLVVGGATGSGANILLPLGELKSMR